MALYKVCLDPGHGGFDPGAVGPGGLKEKDVTLAVCRTVASLLASSGIEVKLTREDDRAVGNDVDTDLCNRCRIANQWGADLFISVHCNSAINPAAHGTETYCLAAGGNGEKLAGAIQKELINALRLTNRGVKYANYYVLRKTNMPAVLTELAFISNPEEERLLGNPNYQEKCATAIARGISKVFGIQIIQEVLFSMFKDVPVKHWAAGSIDRLAKLGIIKGDEQGNFRPDQPITRAEVVALLDRVLKLLGR